MFPQSHFPFWPYKLGQLYTHPSRLKRWNFGHASNKFRPQELHESANCLLAGDNNQYQRPAPPGHPARLMQRSPARDVSAECGGDSRGGLEFRVPGWRFGTGLLIHLDGAAWQSSGLEVSLAAICCPKPRNLVISGGSQWSMRKHWREGKTAKSGVSRQPDEDKLGT